MLTVDENYKKDLQKVNLLLGAFRNVNPLMTIQIAQTLVVVALNEGSSISEVADRAGFKLSTTSRNILDLGARNRKRLPGLGLVDTVTDPMELRKKSVVLTPKGKLLLRQVSDLMRV